MLDFWLRVHFRGVIYPQVDMRRSFSYFMSHDGLRGGFFRGWSLHGKRRELFFWSAAVTTLSCSLYCFLIWIEVLIFFFVKFRGVSGAGKGTPINISQRKARPSRLHLLHVSHPQTVLSLDLTIYKHQHP